MQLVFITRGCRLADFLTGWIRLVEEKELIERFPDYVQNRKQVPTFWVTLRDIPKFYRFLIAGE